MIVINTVAVARATRSELHEAIAAVVAQNASAAAEFEQFTIRTLSNAEAVAHSVLREYERSGSETSLTQMRADGAIDGDVFTVVNVVDETGALVVSSDPRREQATDRRAHDEARAFHAQHDTERLLVGTPGRSAYSDAARIPLSMRRERPDGSFGGFVLLQMVPASFTDYAQSPLKDDILALVGLDGIARARRTSASSTTGDDLRGSSLFTELATRNSGDTLSTSPVDGVRRFFSFRRLKDYPLVVGAAVSEAEALAPVVERRRWYYVRASVLTVIIGLLSAAVIRALTRQKRAVTKLLASEAMLRAREEEFRNVTESMPQMVWITEANGDHSYFNQRWVDYTGLSVAQSVGVGWKAAFDPAEQERAVDRWKQTVAKEELYEAEYRLRGADGTYRWMLARAVPLRDGDGRITKWFGTSTDINHQVAVQAQLREAQEVAHVGSWSRDPHTRAHTWSDELYEILGLSPADFFPSDNALDEMIHPDDREQFVRDRELPLATMAPFRRDVRIIRPDGQVRTVQHSVAVETDRDGIGVRVHGTVQDVTDARAAEQQLREQANLLDLTRDAIIVREADETISFWNNGAERMYGWTAEEVLGNRSQDFASAGSFIAANARRHLAEHGEWSGDAEHLRKDGSTVTVNSRWTLFRNELGAASSVLVVNTDITEHKKLQDQLLRTQRLESIGTLASGVAHDLNNILAPIMMAAPLLRGEMAADKRGQLVSLLEQSAERGAAIVRQVLTFARGADGERVLVQPSYSIREIAEIATETFPRSITVTADYPEDLGLIEADPTQVHQVLLNLCVNARDAMPDGGVLALSASNFHVDEHYAAMTPGLRAGPHILIAVSDTGTGIPPHILGKIFDPFFTTKGVGTGTGLGLSTVLGIVREYGGAVKAESSGRGTTFSILLPASFASAGDVEAPAAEELPRGRGETILVVDDEEAIRAVAEPLLRASGYQVLLAEDGPAALAVFAEQAAAIDVVLTDLAMPVMSGVALARTLRKMQPDACIIVSAGREDDCSPAEFAEIGVVATLPKPYTQSALLRLLDQVISQHRRNL